MFSPHQEAYTQYADSTSDFEAQRISFALPVVRLIARSCWRPHLCIVVHQRASRDKWAKDPPGNSVESFLLASSLVRALSSTDLTGPEDLSFPPGHNESLNILTILNNRVSSNTALMLSLTFL